MKAIFIGSISVWVVYVSITQLMQVTIMPAIESLQEVYSNTEQISQEVATGTYKVQ